MVNRLNLTDIDFMREEIHFQMHFPEDLSPREVFAEGCNRELEELHAAQAELEESLLGRIALIMATLAPTFQAMRDNDVNGPARVQLANLDQSILELEETKEGCSEELMKAKQLLSEMQAKYASLKAKFEHMQQLHRQRQDAALNGIVRGMGDRICDTIRTNSYRK